MISNSLYQHILQLDQHVQGFLFSAEETLGSIVEGPFEKLSSVLQSQRALFYEIEKLISGKVDRLEFGQIVHQKANQVDMQRLILDLIASNNLQARQDSMVLLTQEGEHLHQHESQEFHIGTTTGQHAGKKRRRGRSANHHNHHSYEHTVSNSPLANYVLGQVQQPCSQCAAERHLFRDQQQHPPPTESTGEDLDVVRLNQKVEDIYAALSSCIQSHCVSREELQPLMDLKVSREDCDALLLQKANKQSVATALQRKANKQDIQAIEDKMAQVAQQMGEMHATQANYTELSLRTEEMRSAFERQKESFADLLQTELVNTKLELENGLKKSTARELQKIQKELETVQDTLKRALTQSRDGQDLLERRTDDSLKTFSLRLDNLQELVKQEALAGIKKDRLENSQVSVKLFERQVKVQISELKEVASMFQKELSKIQEAESSIREFVSGRVEEAERIVRASVEQIGGELGRLSKETQQELEQFDKEMAKLRQLVANGQGEQTFKQASVNYPQEVQQAIQNLQLAQGQIQGELRNKSNIADVCALVDMKANTEDLQRGFDELIKEIDVLHQQQRAVYDVRNIREQKAINESFLNLNCLARYVWHGGFTSGGVNLGGTQRSTSAKLRSGKINFDRPSFTSESSAHSSHEYVKWSRELVNTSPDLFELSLEEDDGGALTILLAGVYEISFTIFVPPDIHKPSVQLKVNSKPVLSTIDTQHNLIYHQEQMKNVSVTTFVHMVADLSKVQVSLSNSSIFGTQQNTTSHMQMLDYAFSPDSVKGIIQIKKL